jgi:hypothetical protein
MVIRLEKFLIVVNVGDVMKEVGAMKIMKAILGIALIVGLVGCYSSHVASDYDREVDFASLKTFGWMSRTEESTSPVSNTLLEKRIRNAVGQMLTSEGYQQETIGNPDFLIAYHTGVAEKIDITSYGYGYWPRYYGPGSFDLLQYKEGTVVLDIVEPEANQLVWRGWYVGAIDDREISEEKIYAAVKHILEEFPPDEESATHSIQ